MRYYVTSSDNTWWVIAGQIPGTASEDVPSRDEAIARCRRLVAEEVEAYRRLGQALDVDATEEIIDWALPWWLNPDWLVPLTPALRDAAVRRMDEIAAEVEGALDGLAPGDWDRGPDGGWSVRRTLDHVSGGFEIGIRRLEPWPLDPDRAQVAALAELIARLRSAPAEPVEQSGMNREVGRVRWTARKVVRAARAAQAATRAHVEAGGPPAALAVRHEDAPDDDEPPSEAELRGLADGDTELRALASRDRRARGVAVSYRYYRDRLNRWPLDARERFRAIRDKYRRRLAALDETELALVRVSPVGQCSTVRMELGLGLSHVREHLAQMRAAAR